MSYKGELFFADDDIINVESFIFREEKTLVAFDIIANWGGQGRWRRAGIARLNDHVYESDVDISKQVETGQIGVPCKIEFHVLEQTEHYIGVSGAWIEEGEEYEFEGDLEPAC